MFRHTFMLLLTLLLGAFYLFTLDYASFQFLDVIIIVMLLFSFIFNLYVILHSKKNASK